MLLGIYYSPETSLICNYEEGGAYLEKVVAILGAGIMGAGIAQVTAQSGYYVILRDLQLSLVKEGLRLINENLEQQVEDSIIKPQMKEEILNRIQITTEFTKVKEADLIIESVVENMAVKKQLFNELDNICSKDAILASNTTTLSISEIAAATKYKGRILGLHFHNPVSKTELVEIIKGYETSDDAVKEAREYIRRINKRSIVLEHETPGYIVNRILFPFINEAISMYFEGVASCETIDKAAQLTLNMSKSPLALADEIGLDYLHSSLLYFYEELKDPKYLPHQYFTTMVKAGYWGKKTGSGFYDYEKT